MRCFAIPFRHKQFPARTVTLFKKNNQSLVYKYGKVPVRNSRYETKELPDALFGTFWITSAADELASVFSRQDSVEVKETANDNVALLQANLGKKVTLWLTLTGTAPVVESGVVEKIEKLPSQPGYTNYSNYRIYLQSETSRWLTFYATQITRIDFVEKPALDFESKTLYKSRKKPFRSISQTNKPEQEIGMLYLTNNLGWTPVYSLTLANKGKSRLSLRAEIANDAEDLGDAELRLAVGNPEHKFADRY